MAVKYKFLLTCCLLPCVLLAQQPTGLSGMQIDDSSAFNQMIAEDNENYLAQQQIEQNFQEKAMETLTLASYEEDDIPVPTVEIDEAQDGLTHCLPFDTVKIKGISLIDKRQFSVPDCITKTALDGLAKSIIRTYVKAGFLQTDIKFSKQDNYIVLKVTERKIREITGGSRTVNVNTLFPSHKNHPLNIRYLEQGIERGNALYGNKLTMDVYPHNDGTTTIALDNKATKPWVVKVGIDNYGSKSNKARLTVNAGIDSPLGLSDSLYVGAYSNITSKDKTYNRGANAFYRIPYGAWAFDTYASVSKNKQQIALPSGSYPYRNQSTNIGVKAERVVSRGASHITSAYGGLDYSRKKATLADSKPLAVQSPTLSSVQFGVKHLQKFAKSSWVNDISLEKGIKAFGSDKKNTPFSPEYLRLKAKSDYNHYTNLGNKWLLHNQHTLELQYSDDELYAEKSFDIANRYGVRGFDEFSQKGEKGVMLRNTLFARRYINGLMYFEPYLGIDAGVVTGNDNSYRAAGVALGVNVRQDRQWGVNIEASHGVAKSNDNKTVKEQQASASMHWNF